MTGDPHDAARPDGDAERRRRLAAAQAGLLRALVLAEAPPPGFDVERVRAQARALRAKRRRVVARLRPDLVDHLGDRLAPLFDAYAAANPRRTGSTARDDAAAFTRWLEKRGERLPGRRRWWRRR
ncbi:hypothetical protein LX15_002008 [Streptoalloteichus tenebrarius]|uniref:SCO6045-like C-terminal domain-containing protein n=1 Tax=Streptoalloteichus tenebrarius (strain ATCC 17920 / DSM 40477 / JCM 4838 / CBS 697.72 / NBRC 16177 / NCIMB 11028 / NRRL B-12390 / A12253. 1 / ISP 5477) TaxID=1933 RepID=A0ABT1HS24_STRSD|nr:hypothetical protein [Streptoalloteichus tenebrarius]MCP2258314.1 hypothetical protein [Streptoalloteichus tenebrarius]BFF03478.1 hypothetical protein GCM10020241_51530 [Streptoalloteichus tenebrarius]